MKQVLYYIYFFHRKLRKPRVTRIHMNLFASMILQCVVRLVIYADQLIVRQPSQTNVKNPENLTTTQRCFFTSVANYEDIFFFSPLE